MEDKPLQYGPAIFVGSSIMAQWESLPQAFPQLPLLNTAIGGTQTHEILARLDELVIRHAPPLVCYYCGSNDINAGVPPEAIVANTLKTYATLREHLPGVRFVYLSIIKAPQKRARWDQVDAVNAALCAAAERLEGFTYIDVNPVFFTVEGEPWMGAYVEDQLHLTAEAYERLGRFVAARL